MLVYFRWQNKIQVQIPITNDFWAKLKFRRLNDML